MYFFTKKIPLASPVAGKELQERREKILEQKDLEMIAEIVAKTLEPIQRNVKSIQLTLENDINRKINIIAEGHLDLNRKLDEALKVENEKEMLALYLPCIA